MKTFEITEEQIKDISLGGGKKKIKEMFPVVFQPEETPEEFFNSIFNMDLIRKVDFEKYPNSQFYFDGETFLLEIEKRGENIITWFNYPKIWNPISTKNNWIYEQTQAFLKVRIEEHFKLRDVTPMNLWKMKTSAIEEHFKLRDVTPSYKN